MQADCLVRLNTCIPPLPHSTSLRQVRYAYSIAFTGAICLTLLRLPCAGANVTLTTLYSFTNSTLESFRPADTNSGYGPQSELVQVGDGSLYGTTTQGGVSNAGTIFRITTNGTIATLYSFSGEFDGRYPTAGLVLHQSGSLYGATSEGGRNGDGTIFKITTNGTFTSLYSFDSISSTDGSSPANRLANATDGNLYGTTRLWDTVFRITQSGALTTLYDFGNDVTDPNGLVQAKNGKFYGTTAYGGLSDFGTVFQMTTSGALVTLYEFTGGNDGGRPEARVIEGNDGYLYGTTFQGGSNDVGTVFRISTNGNLTTIYTFTDADDGANPCGDLVQDKNGNLFGTAQLGGKNGFGTLFKLTTNGDITILVSFAEDFVNGAYPLGGLLIGKDGNLYGTTLDGGVRFANGLVYLGNGSVFMATTNGVLNTLHMFNGNNGSSGGLVQGADGNFYGTTVGGGSNGEGIVFRLTANGLFSNLFSFGHTNGANPVSGLVQGADGNLYGAAASGGTSSDGTAFRITTNGTLTTLVSFNRTNGYGPLASLLQGTDGSFYGVTTYGGSSNDLGSGTIFRMLTNGTLIPLNALKFTNGASPAAGLAQGLDGNFYGTTVLGGTNFYGTVFKLATNGTLTSLVSFDSTNGAYPSSVLVQDASGNFYGVTAQGGTNNDGTVFKVTTNGLLTTLYSFSGGMDGANPVAGLVRGSDGNFYGTTIQGGTNGNGTVFQITPTGSLNTLYRFAGGGNGANPVAKLVLATDGKFYGTTISAGTNDNGTVFRLTVPMVPMFKSVARTGQSLAMTLSTVAGQQYQIQYRTNLTQTTWSNLGSSITATNGTSALSDAIGPDRQRFYRAVLLP